MAVFFPSKLYQFDCRGFDSSSPGAAWGPQTAWFNPAGLPPVSAFPERLELRGNDVLVRNIALQYAKVLRKAVHIRNRVP